MVSYWLKVGPRNKNSELQSNVTVSYKKKACVCFKKVSPQQLLIIQGKVSDIHCNSIHVGIMTVKIMHCDWLKYSRILIGWNRYFTSQDIGLPKIFGTAFWKCCEQNDF